MGNEYELSKVGFDAVILSIFNRKLRVVLKKREKEPFRGFLELPGGLLRTDEEIEVSMKRKLTDFFSHNVYFRQFYTFTDPKRDIRGRVISIGFIAIVDYDKAVSIRKPDYFSEDSDCWYPVKRILKSKEIAFDHLKIIERAVSDIKLNLDKDLASRFIPFKFPLNKLQEVYEILSEKKFDNRNFRKKALKSYVLPTEYFEENVDHRPAKLYKIRT